MKSPIWREEEYIPRWYVVPPYPPPVEEGPNVYPVEDAPLVPYELPEEYILYVIVVVKVWCLKCIKGVGVWF